MYAVQSGSGEFWQTEFCWWANGWHECRLLTVAVSIDLFSVDPVYLRAQSGYFRWFDLGGEFKFALKRVYVDITRCHEASGPAFKLALGRTASWRSTPVRSVGTPLAIVSRCSATFCQIAVTMSVYGIIDIVVSSRRIANWMRRLVSCMAHHVCCIQPVQLLAGRYIFQFRRSVWLIQHDWRLHWLLQTSKEITHQND